MGHLDAAINAHFSTQVDLVYALAPHPPLPGRRRRDGVVLYSLKNIL